MHETWGSTFKIWHGSKLKKKWGEGVKTNTKISADFNFRKKKDKEVYAFRNKITLSRPQIVLGSLTVLKAKD